MPMTSTATDRLSTALAGRYCIERHLGEGGMAIVYLAHDGQHDRKVVVKVLAAVKLRGSTAKLRRPRERAAAFRNRPRCGRCAARVRS
jgi:hypothetical protein